MPRPLTTAALGLLLCAPLAAQDSLAVPKFPILPSPIGLHADVRPNEFLGVEGRKAAWLGQETGQAELWVHPLKVAEDFHLDFRIPDYEEPVRGADVARTVDVRPDVTTITYSHATFTVREHIFVPQHEPGTLILLDVQTIHPLQILVQFKTVMQYAWPAGFGGQNAHWDDADKAFVLSESLARKNAFIGSPWATVASNHPAHDIPEAPNLIVIPVDTARARHEFIPIAIAAGTAPRDSVRAAYLRLITHARELYQQKHAYVTALLDSTTTLVSPDTTVDLALQWAKVNLDEARVCNPDLGCGLVAGWGPSGRGERPGFGWFFGGDAAINSFAMDALGMTDEVGVGLRFLATYQDHRGGANEGKIPHEISQAAAHIPWFTAYPYPYYHVDTTPFWLVALWRYWLATGDRHLVDSLWPNARAAFAWSRTRDTDGDGLMEDGPANMGAIEVGALKESIHEDIYVAAVWIEALRGMQDLARLEGDVPLADSAAAIERIATATLNDRLWRPREGHYAFGILNSGKTNDNLTVWPATAASFHLLDSARAERTLQALARDSISSDWGAHILSTGSPLYDPMHYNNGAVWPFVTGFAAWGQYRYRRPWSAWPLVNAVAQMTFDFSRGRDPELLSGAFYRPLDTAVPQQFFSNAMLVSPLLYGAIGWSPDAPRGRARLAPQLPPDWDTVTVRHLKAGASDVTVGYARAPGRTRLTLRGTGPALGIDLVLAVPAGARDVRLQVDGRDVPTHLTAGYHDQTVTTTVRTGARAHVVTTTWAGGLSVVAPTTRLVPGQTSTGLRVLDFRAEGRGYTLTLEGERGRTYAVNLIGESVRTAGATVAAHTGDRTTLAVPFPAGTGRTTLVVRLAQ